MQQKNINLGKLLKSNNTNRTGVVAPDPLRDVQFCPHPCVGDELLLVATSVLLAPAPQPVAPPVVPDPLGEDNIDDVEPPAFVPFTWFGGHVQ